MIYVLDTVSPLPPLPFSRCVLVAPPGGAGASSRGGAYRVQHTGSLAKPRQRQTFDAGRLQPRPVGTVRANGARVGVRTRLDRPLLWVG